MTSIFKGNSCYFRILNSTPCMFWYFCCREVWNMTAIEFVWFEKIKTFDSILNPSFISWKIPSCKINIVDIVFKWTRFIMNPHIVDIGRSWCPLKLSISSYNLVPKSIFQVIYYNSLIVYGEPSCCKGIFIKNQESLQFLSAGIANNAISSDVVRIKLTQ